MSDFTRVSLVGTKRRATFVIPSDEPLGVLVPDLALLVDEPLDGESALALVGQLGQEIDLTATAEEQELADGTVLRFTRLEETPQPPEVADVTDAVADVHDEISTGWTERHRLVCGAIAVALLVLVATLATSEQRSPDASGGLLTGLIGAVPRMTSLGLLLYGVGIVGSLLARFQPAAWLVPLSTALALGATPACALAIGNELADRGIGVLGAADGFSSSVVVVAGMSVLAWIVLGAGFGIGRRDRSPLLGTLIGIVSSVVIGGFAGAGVPLVPVAAVLALAVIAALGLLPAAALTVSGVTALDDEQLAGRPAKRWTVRARVLQAYRSLAWAMYAVAGLAAYVTAVLVADGSLWPMLLGASVALVVLLRTRVVPLPGLAWPLWAAGVLGPVIGLVLSDLPAAVKPGVLLGAVVLAGALVAIRPAKHLRVRLRRFGDLLETVAALASVPCALGVYGVYAIALGAFS